MTADNPSLADVFDGWQGFQESLVRAVTPLDAKQLGWRPSDSRYSVGELVRHIALGRIGWFARMSAPGSAELAAHISQWEEDRDGNNHVVETAVPMAGDAVQLVHWLEKTWQMIAQTLDTWTVADLPVSYHHKWNGDVYANSRHWTLWRILTHDVYHGGQLSLILGMQGIEHFELGPPFWHLTAPPLVDTDST